MNYLNRILGIVICSGSISCAVGSDEMETRYGWFQSNGDQSKVWDVCFVGGWKLQEAKRLFEGNKGLLGNVNYEKYKNRCNEAELKRLKLIECQSIIEKKDRFEGDFQTIAANARDERCRLIEEYKKLNHEINEGTNLVKTLWEGTRELWDMLEKDGKGDAEFHISLMNMIRGGGS